jgi:hypothetical protein
VKIEQLGRRLEEPEAVVVSERLARAHAEEKAARLIETEGALLARTEEVGRLRAERDEVLRRHVRTREKARTGSRGDLWGRATLFGGVNGAFPPRFPNIEPYVSG